MHKTSIDVISDELKAISGCRVGAIIQLPVLGILLPLMIFFCALHIAWMIYVFMIESPVKIDFVTFRDAENVDVEDNSLAGKANQRRRTVIIPNVNKSDANLHFTESAIRLTRIREVANLEEISHNEESLKELIASDKQQQAHSLSSNSTLQLNSYPQLRTWPIP